MKVSELEGPMLDFWVVMALGEKAKFTRDRAHAIRRGAMYAPSVRWSHGGPLLDRFRIGVMQRGGEWGAWLPEDMEPSGTGPSALIAAMRALVASKYGVTIGEVRHD